MNADLSPRVLGPRLFRAAQILWWMLLPMAVVSIGLSLVTEGRRIAADARGFGAAGLVLLDGDPPSVEVFGRAATAAGLNPDYTLIAVAGRPVESAQQARDAVAALPPGAALRLTTADEDGRIREHVVPRSSATLEEFKQRTGVSFSVFAWLSELMSAFVDGLWITASVLLFRTRGREAMPKALSLGTLGLVTASLLDVAVALHPAFAVIGAIFAPIAFLLTAWALTAFPNGRLDRRWQRIAMALVALACAGMGAAVLADAEWEAVAVLLLVGTFPIAAAAVWGRWRRMPEGVQRQQIKWAAGGLALGSACLLLGVVLLVASAAAMSSFGASAWLELLGLTLCFLGVSAIIGGLLVALLRYRLFDAEAVIGRSTAFGGLAVIGVAIWTAAERVLQGFLADTLGLNSGPTLAALFATLSALVVIPARKRLTNLTQKRFQPSLAALRTEVPERLRDLKDTAAPREIAQAVVAEVARAVRSRGAALVSDGGRTVEAADALTPEKVTDWTASRAARLGRVLDVEALDPVVPVVMPLMSRTESAPRRWLLLGPRPDGSPPSSDDLKAVKDLAGPLTRALDAAADRQARDMRLEAEITSLRAELARLSARLASD